MPHDHKSMELHGTGTHGAGRHALETPSSIHCFNQVDSTDLFINSDRHESPEFVTRFFQKSRVLAAITILPWTEIRRFVEADPSSLSIVLQK
jgi:hypothetical protein